MIDLKFIPFSKDYAITVTKPKIPHVIREQRAKPPDYNTSRKIKIY